VFGPDRITGSLHLLFWRHCFSAGNAAGDWDPGCLYCFVPLYFFLQRITLSLNDSPHAKSFTGWVTGSILGLASDNVEEVVGNNGAWVYFVSLGAMATSEGATY
jgi:hypothetical protein